MQRQLLDALLRGVQAVTQYAWHLSNFKAGEFRFIQQIVQHLLDLFKVCLQFLY